MTTPPCPKCGSLDVLVHEHLSGTGRRWKCKSCRRKFRTGTNPPRKKEDRQLGPDREDPGLEIAGNAAVLTGPREGKPPTLESLFAKFEIDPDEWEVQSYKINEWQQHSTEHGVVSLYQGKATLIRKRPIICEWPVVQPVNLKPLPAKYAARAGAGLKRAVLCYDAQVGFFRDFDRFQIHPLHDLQVFACATAAIREIKPDLLVLGGDMMDLPDWSDHFLQGPEFAWSTQASINWIGRWIQAVRPYCGRVVWLAGNHEARMTRGLIANVPSAYKLRPANLPAAPPVMSIQGMVGLEALDVEYIDDYPGGEVWINSNLKAIHGEKVGAKSGQTAMKMIEGSRASVIQGHVHRAESAHVTVRSQTKTITYGAYSMPAMCRIDGVVPGADGRENWQQGFGLVHYDDRLFQVETVNVWGGQMIFKGRLYAAEGRANTPLNDEAVKSLMGGSAVADIAARRVA